MSADKKKIKKVEILNRKAEYEYQFIQEYEAGIQLTGTEIKTIREGNANLNDSFCAFQGDELFVLSLFIAEYEFGNVHNHETRRRRRLLLKRQELNKLQRKVKEKGFTIIPYKLYINDKGLAKLGIALATGKKAFDKRETIKDRENKREMDRLKKIKL
jgi:SsrA-binding protein